MLSYGTNSPDVKITGSTIHSELKAINNLKQSEYLRTRTLEKVNILIIRVSSTGVLGISKPCLKCMVDLNTLPQKKGYIIDRVSYSTMNETIEHTTLNKLTLEVMNGNYHMSKYYRRNNYKNPFTVI